MKAILGWLGDPYVHMFAVGLVLVRLAMGVGDDDANVSASAPGTCPTCHAAHAGGAPCVWVVVQGPEVGPPR